MQKLLLPFLFFAITLFGCEDFTLPRSTLHVHVTDDGEKPQRYLLRIYRDGKFVKGDEFDREYDPSDYYTEVGNAEPGMYLFTVNAYRFGQQYFDGEVEKRDSLSIRSFNKRVTIDISE